MRVRVFYEPKMALHIPFRIAYGAWNKGALLNTGKPPNKERRQKWWALWMRLGWHYWSIQLHT
jgi:hypothetical protein